MHTQLGHIDDLIEEFYEAAVRPEFWRTALQKAADVFAAEGTCLLTSPTCETGVFWSKGLDELANAFIDEGWYARNARIERGIPLRHTKPVLTETDLFSEDELIRLPFNAEFINAHGFRWMAGSTICDTSGRYTIFTMERKATTERFDNAEIEALEACLPHLRRSAEIAGRLSLTEGKGMLDAFEKMGCAALLLDDLGKVQHLNARAQRHIGREIQIIHGTLTTCHKEANSALQQLIGELIQPCRSDSQAKVTAVIPRRNNRPLFAYGMPVVRSAQDIFQRGKAILIIVDPDEHLSLSKIFLKQIFKLTPAEVRLALALAAGRSLNDFAEQQQVSVGTARIQLKSIMAKTSTHRQAELVALLAQLSRAQPAE